MSLFRRKPQAAPASPPAPPPPHIELFYWKPPEGMNFGDHLASVIATKVAADAGYFFDEEVAVSRRLLGVGSVLHFARPGDIVWGSGVNGKIDPDRHSVEGLDIRAVRGPLTRDFLMQRGAEVPEIFGDPALLIARLLGHRFASGAKRSGVVHVPNLHDIAIMRDWESMVSPLWPWAEVVRRIAAAEHVIASSLHGLVIADAFDVPCTYVRLSETESPFKYEDYCLGAGRGALRITHSREEAVRATPLDPVHPDLDRLIGSFPLDLWQAKATD